jgi:hypothetical protein
MAAFFKCSATALLVLAIIASSDLAGAEDRASNAGATIQPAGEAKVVAEIPRTQWCQCVRAILDVEGGDIAGCVKSGASEEKLKIFRQRGTGDGSSKSVSFLLSFAGCSESENENVGSLSFSMEWQDRPVRPHAPQAEKAAQRPEPPLAPVSCTAGGIARIEATLYRSHGKKLASAGPWDCSTLAGTLNNIPTAAGIRIVITGRNASGAVLYRAERTNITIAYKQKTALGTIEAPSFTPVLSEPGHAAMLGSGRVKFAWTRPAGATAYRIQVANNPGFVPAVVDTAAQTLSFATGTALPSGAYFWRIQAQDDLKNSGEWSSPGSITVDADPPVNTTGKTFINHGSAATNAHAASLAIAATKKMGSGIIAYYISEQPKKPAADAKGWTAIPSTMSYAADVPYTLSKRDGKKTISVWFKDALGHVSAVKSGAITIDTNLPRATIVSHPADPTNSTLANFAFTSTKARSKFQCQLDDGVYSVCTGTSSYEGLLEGQHTFRVKVSDAIGNKDLAPESFTWTIDLTPPRTEITSQPPAETDSDAAPFSFASTKTGSTFQCRLDNRDYPGCSSPRTYPGLATGQHTFTVRATDAAGNTDPNPPQYTWTIIESFTTTITESPADPSRSTSAQFGFTANRDGATFRCRLDNGDHSACTSPMTYTALAQNSHTFSVQAIDATGKLESAPAQHTWTVRLPPSFTTGLSHLFDGQTIPDSPAFAVLGATPPLITRPASPRKMAFSAVAGFDQDGTAQFGIAADVSPYLLLREKELTLERYQNSTREQALSRIQLSFAATSGQTMDETLTRLAVSARWTIWDDGDIRLDKDLIACINGDRQEAAAQHPSGTAPGRTEAGTARPLAGETALETRTRSCRDESGSRNWNRSAADVGIAPAWIDKAGTGSGLTSNGYSAWASISYGFDRFDLLKDNSQITFLARIRKDEIAPDPDVSGQFLVRDRNSLGFQYRYGDRKETFLFQGLFVQSKNKGEPASESFTMSLGTEFGIADNTWVQLEIGLPSSLTPPFMTIQIKWAP